MSCFAQVLYAEQVLVLGLRQAKHPKADAQALGMTRTVVSNALVMFSKVKKNFGIGGPTDSAEIDPTDINEIQPCLLKEGSALLG